MTPLAAFTPPSQPAAVAAVAVAVAAVAAPPLDPAPAAALPSVAADAAPPLLWLLWPPAPPADVLAVAAAAALLWLLLLPVMGRQSWKRLVEPRAVGTSATREDSPRDTSVRAKGMPGPQLSCGCHRVCNGNVEELGRRRCKVMKEEAR